MRGLYTGASSLIFVAAMLATTATTATTGRVARVASAWGSGAQAASGAAASSAAEPARGVQAADEAQAVGNQACRPCHQAIVDSYARTAMARTSGAASIGLEGAFQHAPSGVSYRVLRDGQQPRLAYERADRGALQGMLQGTHALEYYLGSNTRGRTFLFDIDGFLYQSPINYYAGKRAWEMSPGFAQVREMPLRPVDATCLFCHASRVEPVRPGTVHGFTGPPFLQDGVGCERCHGPGSEHVRAKGRVALINPAALAGERRDSICAQCHLEGEARIARAGRSQEDYRPGDRLSDFVAIFVREDDARQRRAAVSHVESLAVSRCKIASGDSLSCITCHDPHVQPAAAERAAFYRTKCLSCHASLAERHHPREPDCTTCHMPRMESADISHTAVTDHRIVRERSAEVARPSSVGRLIPFGATPSTPETPGTRELGLAYGEVALRGDAFAAGEAMRLLEQARRQNPAGTDADADVLTRLGSLYQARDDFSRAEQAYTQALKIDPSRALVAGNVGVFEAQRGRLAQSLTLWRAAFATHPELSEIGINLGRGLCLQGDAAGATAVLQRVLRHNPDLGIARQAIAEIAKTGCRQP
jgi:Flp pilus assembly protein TadD